MRNPTGILRSQVRSSVLGSDCGIICTAIFSLSLMQVGQLSVSGESMGT